MSFHWTSFLGAIPVPLNNGIKKLVSWFKSHASWRTWQQAAEPLIAPPAEPTPEPPWPLPPAPEPPPARLNRSARRALSAYERARLKKDKFVTPKVQAPEKPAKPAKPREPHPKHVNENPEPVPDALTDSDISIVDKHHSDGELVAYKESEFWGEFYFRDTILDQLDRYQLYLSRMKKHDLQSYEFYRRVGITIIPYFALGHRLQRKVSKMAPEELTRWREKIVLPPYFRQHRPSFGCFAHGTDPLSEKLELEETKECEKSGKWLWIPKFFYFLKYQQPPPAVEMVSGGDVYKLTVWWDRPHDPKARLKWGRPTEFALFIDADGKTIRGLKHLDTEMVRIPSRKNGLDKFAIPQRAWKFPEEATHWAGTYGVDGPSMIAYLFCTAVEQMEWSHYSMVRVAAEKNDMTAIFGVNVRRLNYFFKDRDVTLTDTGSVKRVFHIVRAHERTTKHGTTAVKFHFRGEREFEWAGYKVSITVPGRDHVIFDEFDLGMIDSYWREKGHKYVTQAELGERLAKLIKGDRKGAADGL